ncbi:MAG: sugar transferase, partial [Candidatus Eisenbacteria sp.]|nr:sugar transferase [Candidatus Eisenbacteria bacterium]
MQSKVEVRVSRAGRKKRSIILGAGFSGRTLAREIVRSRNGFETVGFVDDDPGKVGKWVDGLEVFGSSDRLVPILQERGANTVIVAIRSRARQSWVAGVLASCEASGVRVLEMPRVFEALTGKVPVEHVDRSWFRDGIGGIGRSRSYSFWKRAGDIVLSVVALAAFSVALPFAAVVIKLDSRGPVFFRQDRVGLRGRVFRLYKLRTMVADAEGGGDPVWAETDDTRVTRVGRYFRKYRFDELPQFWNVLLGQMCVVGPRPERQFFVDQLCKELPHYDLRHEVKPGITGWAQVCQGYASSCRESFEKLQFDLYYLRHRSLIWDLAIVL